jgi:hypothetical protein
VTHFTVKAASGAGGDAIPDDALAKAVTAGWSANRNAAENNAARIGGVGFRDAVDFGWFLSIGLGNTAR